MKNKNSYINNQTINKTSEITSEKLNKYFDVTSRALAKIKTGNKIKIGKQKNIDWKASAEDFLNMAECYFKDAQHFKEKNEIVNAFAALNYAHGWLDAGARLGLFDVDGDNVLFTVDAKKNK